MSQSSKKNTEGSHQEWGEIWSEYSAEESPMMKLFTRSTPRSIYEFWQKAYFDDFKTLFDPDREYRFLELGSGRGTTSMYLASEGWEDITLVDLAETALEQARKNFASENLRPPNTKLANAEDTGLPANEFDAIYNIGVLEHFEDPVPLLTEAVRLLKPGGQIFMPIVPDAPFLKSMFCRALFNPWSLVKYVGKQLLRPRVKVRDTNMIRTNTSRHQYIKFAMEAGLTNVRCVPYNPYWKVNEDNSMTMNRIALPLYRTHFRMKRSLGFRFGMTTLGMMNFCLLLTGEKS